MKADSESTKKSSSQETASQIQALLEVTKSHQLDERADATRLDNLRRIFAQLVQCGDLSFPLSNDNDDPQNIDSSNKVSVSNQWNKWLRQKHKAMVSQLVERIVTHGRRTAVRTLLGVLAASPRQTPHNHILYVNTDLLYQWMRGLLEMPLGGDHGLVKDKVIHHVLQAELVHCDIQYYSFCVLARWAQQTYHMWSSQKRTSNSKETPSSDKTLSLEDLQEQADRMLEILMIIPVPTSQADLDGPDSRYMFAPPKTTTTTSHDSDTEDSDSDSEDADGSDDGDDDGDDNSNDDNVESLRQSSSKAKQSALLVFQQVKAHRNAQAKAWMALLRLPLSTTTLKRALPFLSQQVLPRISQPLRFADFYMEAYTSHNRRIVETGSKEYVTSQKDNHDSVATTASSGVIPWLALDGLFYLMTQHRLEYPDFYVQLYTLITPSLLYVKYRTRFFSLLQKCLLRNDRLPAYLVAAFAKRLCRCALQGPPASALFLLALVSNLLRQHEECAALIHRRCYQERIEGDAAEHDDSNDDDPYDAHATDPVKSKAMQSSLWELHALERHYHPAVATLAHSIGREDPKSPMLNMDDMLAHSYTSLSEQERKRHKPSSSNSGSNKKKAKYSTPVTFVAPTGLFVKDDVFAGFLKLPRVYNDELRVPTSGGSWPVSS